MCNRHACVSQEVYLQEEYYKDKQLNFPSLDCTIPGMETARDNNRPNCLHFFSGHYGANPLLQ